MKTRLSLKYSVNDFRCHISSYYGTSRPIKREFAIYGTSRLGRKFANEDDTSRPSKRELTIYGTSRPRGVKKMQKLLESKNEQKKKRKIKIKMKTKTKIHFYFHFRYLLFSFLFLFLFYFFSFCF